MAKNISFTFRGLMAGTFTPYNADLSVNTAIIPQYAKYLAEKKVPGILINGTTSEGPSMTVQERKSLAEAWLPAVKPTKQHLMVQVGACPLPDAKELAKHAEKIGVDSILCLPELYFKPKTPQELINYLKLIAEAAPKTPLFYYHNPRRSGVDVNMEKFLDLSVGQIPTFHGIKFAISDLSEACDAMKAADGRYTVFIAEDTLIQPALALGFDSFSTTAVNVFPEHFVKIVEAMKENKVLEARVLQAQLTACCKAIEKNGDSIPTMKTAMDLVSPINVGAVRPPQINPTEAQRKEMADDLKTLNIVLL